MLDVGSFENITLSPIFKSNLSMHWSLSFIKFLYDVSTSERQYVCTYIGDSHGNMGDNISTWHFSHGVTVHHTAAHPCATGREVQMKSKTEV